MTYYKCDRCGTECDKAIPVYRGGNRFDLCEECYIDFGEFNKRINGVAERAKMSWLEGVEAIVP